MQFDNKQTVIKLTKRRYLSFISYTVGLILLFFSGWFEKPVLGIDKTIYVLSISILYILYIVITFITNYNFFSFKDEEDEFVFKFVSLRPFDNKKKSIIIKKKNFRGAEIKKALFNLKIELVLFVETKRGKVSYPPISISALESKYIKVLMDSLNKL